MVQQIASVKTESAASALPFTLSASALSVQSETRQTFNNELLRQSRNSSGLDQASRPNQSEYTKQTNTQSERYSTTTRSKNSDTRTERQNSEIEKQKAENARVKEKADDQQLIRQKEITDTKDKDANTALRSNSDSNYRAESGNQKTPYEGKVFNAAAGENEAVDGASIAELELVLPHTKPTEKEQQVTDAAVTLAKDDSSTEQFDYIDYVTELVEFTGGAVQQNTDPQNTSERVNTNSVTNILPSGSAAIAELQLNLEDANGNYNIPNEFINTKIPKVELQSTVDMQPVKATNDIDVFAQARENASNIVDDLIDQFEVLPKDISSLPNGELSDADKTLLSDLLVSSSSQSSTNAEQNDVDLQTLINPESAPVNQVSINEKIKPNDFAIAGQQNTAINNMTVQENLVKSDVKSELLSSEDANANAHLANIKQATMVENNVTKTGIEGNKPDLNSPSLRNITQLNDEQSKVALESLSSRVQAVASEINGEAKGNQFIAALQSGVKEFKQQLALGNEPDLDLKALVAEALAQISGESTSTLQPKVDATVKQFNAVLNLANTINYAAIQQQTERVEITENQLAKEFNLQHIEGTKLANGIQSQLNAQASVDKAINIFKQEGQQKLAEKVRWMVNSKNASAEIRLDPPDLGGINIKVNLSGDTALVNFNVQSMAAKEALDQAVPKLREMLQEQGIELGESVVQQDSQGGKEDEPSNSGNNLAQGNAQTSSDAIADNEVNANHSVVEQRVSGGVLGGVDYYA